MVKKGRFRKAMAAVKTRSIARAIRRHSRSATSSVKNQVPAFCGAFGLICRRPTKPAVKNRVVRRAIRCVVAARHKVGEVLSAIGVAPPQLQAAICVLPYCAVVWLSGRSCRRRSIANAKVIAEIRCKSVATSMHPQIRPLRLRHNRELAVAIGGADAEAVGKRQAHRLSLAPLSVD